MISTTFRRLLKASAIRSRLGDHAVKGSTASQQFYRSLLVLLLSLKYAKRCAKKTLVGRKKCLSHHDIFLRNYLQQLLGLRPPVCITCIGLSGEGPGSQALTIMHAITFARTYGLRYIHTPFSHIEHADRAIPDWINGWERQFNFGYGEAMSDGKPFDYCRNCYEMFPIFAIDDLTNFTPVLSTTIPEFRRKYYCNKSPRKNEILTIVVQVRRREVTSSHSMWTSTSFIVGTIAKVRAVLDAHNIKYKIIIFSQADIAELNSPETEIYVDADPIWTMQEAIEADILIMAKSTFSYVSAVLSDGIKIYEPFKYPPLNDWVIRGPNDKFDHAAFERQLILYRQIAVEQI